MDYSVIANRYAKAFFSFAAEKKQLDEVRDDMHSFIKLYHDVPEFKILLQSPVIGNDSKIKALNATFTGRVSAASLSLLKLLVDNRRTAHFVGICKVYLQLYAVEKGIKSALFTTAVEINNELITQLKDKLEEELKLIIELHTKVKPELIGGFIMRLGDLQYDASVSTKLHEIREELLSVEV